MSSKKSRALFQDVGNSLVIQSRVLARLNALLTDTWDFCVNNPSGKDGGRSTGKTDIIHGGLREAILDCFGNTKTQFEHRFSLRAEEADASGKTKRLKLKDCLGSNFHPDLMLFDRLHRQEDTVILAKARMFGLNKNRNNNASNSLGEAQKILAAECNKELNVLAFNFTPKNSFLQKKGALHCEKVNPLGFNTEVVEGKRALDLFGIIDSIKERIYEVNVSYDLKFKNPESPSKDLDIKNITSKAQLKEVVAFHVKNNIPFIVLEKEDIQEFINYCMQLSHRVHTGL